MKMLNIGHGLLGNCLLMHALISTIGCIGPSTS